VHTGQTDEANDDLTGVARFSFRREFMGSRVGVGFYLCFLDSLNEGPSSTAYINLGDSRLRQPSIDQSNILVFYPFSYIFYVLVIATAAAPIARIGDRRSSP
jgi:hypothetical protein